MASVEQLYKDFGVLADAKDKAGEHEEEFLSILSAVKGTTSEKRLASQFIARFFKYFPDLALKAIDAQLDLCEDEDLAIRKQAIKDLPMFCRDTQEHLGRIADVLTQLLQSDDASELGIVHSSLLALFKYDAKGALGGLFSQILQGEDVVRDRAIKFLATKLKLVPEEALTPEVEEYLVTESKKVLADVTGDEFVAFMKILSSMKCMNTLKGRQQMVEIVTEQADLDQPFEPTDPDCVDRLVQCIRQALPFFSKNVHSSLFVGYMCDNVLPNLSKVTSHEAAAADDTAEGAAPKGDIQLEVLKLFAEMSQYCGLGLGENQLERVEKLYNTLTEYMPQPPAVTDTEGENGENGTANETPQLQFSYVECLMYAFHQLGAKCPEFLTDDDNADRLKDFRLRLQFFARGVQVYIKQLRVALNGKTADDLKTDENKIKVVALKITNNINLLIKDLFHNPPSYKTLINMSWKPVGAKPSVTSPGQKRSHYTPITYEGGTPAAKKERKQSQDRNNQRGGQPAESRKLYSPPTGRWSDNAGTYTDGGDGRSGNRGRGGFRGGYRSGFRGRGRGRGGFRRGNRW